MNPDQVVGRNKTNTEYTDKAHPTPRGPHPTDDRLHLADRRAARLCHDRGGCLGGLLGTLERVTEATPTEAIATDTIPTLNRRLRLWRTIWAGTGKPLDLPHPNPPCLTPRARELAARRIALDAGGLPPTTILSPVMARLGSNLLVLAAEPRPGDGALRLDRAPPTASPDGTAPRPPGPPISPACWPIPPPPGPPCANRGGARPR